MESIGKSESDNSLILCEVCKKGEEYHTCLECSKHVCRACFNTIHFGIGAPRSGKSMVYSTCVFCNEIFGRNTRVKVCEKCEIVLTWTSSMNFLAAVNRLSELIKLGKLDSKLRNESYCKKNFGDQATLVIMDAIEGSTRWWQNSCYDIALESTHIVCSFTTYTYGILIISNSWDDLITKRWEPLSIQKSRIALEAGNGHSISV